MISRTLVTADGKVISLNNEQNIAADLELEWWESPDRFFLLSGFAGTGKTTVSKWFLSAISERGVGGRSSRKPVVCVAAPTHKAKRVIGRATGVPAHSLHRLLGLGLDLSLDEFDPENPQFKPKKPPIINDYDLIILDEASQVNLKLFKYLNDQIKGSTKMLIMADAAQLPPVGEKLSVIFETPVIRWRANLTHVERTADDNPALLIYDTIRNNLFKPNDSFAHVDVLNERGEGVLFRTQPSFGQAILSAFLSPEYDKDPNYAKIACWTNNQVDWWNQGLRLKRLEKLHPGVKHLPVMSRDVLFAYSGYEGKLENGNDYVVTRVIETNFGFKHPSKNGLVSMELPTLGVYLTNTDTGRSIFIHILDYRKPGAVNKYIKAYWAFIGESKVSGWKQFFDFRSWIMLMQPIDAGGQFPIKKDIDYGYAITVHKIQGSEYTNIFVDGVEINRNPITRERNSMKYVALSRMTKLAYYRI